MSLKERISSLPLHTKVIYGILISLFVTPILPGIVSSITHNDISLPNLSIDKRSTKLTNDEVVGTYKGSSTLRSGVTYAIKLELKVDGTYILNSYTSVPGLETKEQVTRGTYETMVETMEDKNEYNEVLKSYFAHGLHFIPSEYPYHDNLFYRVNDKFSLDPIGDYSGLMDPGRSTLHRIN